jgi:hypothetical protein
MERVDPVDRVFGKYERVVAVVSVVFAGVLTIEVIVSAALTRWGHVMGATLALVALGAVNLLRRNPRRSWACYGIVLAVVVTCVLVTWLTPSSRPSW